MGKQVLRPLVFLVPLAIASMIGLSPTPSLGAANAREGCINQWLFNGVWRVQVTKVEPFMNGTQQTGWQVTEVWRNGTTEGVAPGDTQLTDQQLELGNGTTLTAKGSTTGSLSLAASATILSRRQGSSRTNRFPRRQPRSEQQAQGRRHSLQRIAASADEEQAAVHVCALQFSLQARLHGVGRSSPSRRWIDADRRHQWLYESVARKRRMENARDRDRSQPALGPVRVGGRSRMDESDESDTLDWRPPVSACSPDQRVQRVPRDAVGQQRFIGQYGRKHGTARPPCLPAGRSVHISTRVFLVALRCERQTRAPFSHF